MPEPKKLRAPSYNHSVQDLSSSRFPKASVKDSVLRLLMHIDSEKTNAVMQILLGRKWSPIFRIQVLVTE